MFESPTNETRAGWAEAAADVFAAATFNTDTFVGAGEEKRDVITDLLANLLHLAAREDINPLEALRTAVSAFNEEREEEGDDGLDLTFPAKSLALNAPGEAEAAAARLDALTPDERSRVLRAEIEAKNFVTFTGYACIAYVDRMGGIVITDTTDGRDTYIQPGDDAAALEDELEAADATPEPTTSAALGSNDLIENILREYL